MSLRCRGAASDLPRRELTPAPGSKRCGLRALAPVSWSFEYVVYGLTIIWLEYVGGSFGS